MCGWETLNDRAIDIEFILCKGMESLRGGTGGGLSLSTLGGGVGGGSGKGEGFRRGGKGGGARLISTSSITLEETGNCIKLDRLELEFGS
uniref:Uncharacterized protein n=1 Tax=Arion vulgaris TaxID=1028688 RepID=A0A0B7ALD7_9EUPU